MQIKLHVDALEKVLFFCLVFRDSLYGRRSIFATIGPKGLIFEKHTYPTMTKASRPDDMQDSFYQMTESTSSRNYLSDLSDKKQHCKCAMRELVNLSRNYT